MKSAAWVVSLFVFLVAVVAVGQQRAASAAPEVIAADVFDPPVETFAKKCSFNSDCPHGTCKGGQCGGCSFNSDCKGWGTCKGGQCGGCSFASDCKGFGTCSSGKCTKSPY